MATFTLEWETAGAGTIPTTTRRRRRVCWGKCSESTSAYQQRFQGLSDSTGQPILRSAGLPEIWDFGVRNPWKFSFDDPARGGTGALIIADVGQGAWEEIDYEPRNRGGRNYGWRILEGTHDNVTTLPPAFTPLTNPIFEYDHSIGNSVTGGYVYRGSVGAPYQGRYFFADFVSGRVWSLALGIDRPAAKLRPRASSSTPRRWEEVE